MSNVANNGLIEIRVPDIGNYKDVEVIEVAVKAGDSIGVEGTLITLETEKATMDVPSTTAGTIRELKVQRGARVSQGDVIAVVEAAASAVAPAPTAPAMAGEVVQVPARSRQASPHRSPLRSTRGQGPHPNLRSRKRARRRASTSPDSLGRTRVRRSASSRVNWASISRRSRARATRAASPTST